MSDNIYVGLDLSLTATGVAIRHPDGELHTYRVKSKPKDGNDLIRISKICDGIFEELDNLSDPIISIEGYAYGVRGSRVFTIGELGGVIKYELKKRGWPFYAIPPNTLKLFTTAKGNSSKDVMMLEAHKKYDVNAPNNDENDAAMLAIMSMYLNDPPARMYKYQKRACDGVELITWD